MLVVDLYKNPHNMEKLLNQLLVLVDFSENCRTTLNHLMPLANELMCDIHLLHVVSGSVNNENSLAAAKIDLKQWQSDYLHQLKNGLLIYSQCLRGPVEKLVRDYVNRYPIDLLILMQHTPFAWTNWRTRINIDRLAGKIKCPVLNLPKAESIQAFRNIVIPITESLPLRKILFATYLARYHNAGIHLVALESNQHLLKTYQLLRDNTNLRIECHIAQGTNMADTALLCAEKVNADLILVQPGLETALGGFLNTVFSRFLFSTSRFPVMAV
jgi:hypothetical protein